MIMRHVAVCGDFDDLRSRQMRFLQEAAKFGAVYVRLWSDQLCRILKNHAPKFTQQERLYFVRALRYVRKATVTDGPGDCDSLPALKPPPDIWVVDQAGDNTARRKFSRIHGLDYQVITDEQLRGFPWPAPEDGSRVRSKVIVTGCYDWLHTGHIRFFEEAAKYGELYVVVGHDRNIQQLKGLGHPLLPQEERGYLVQSIRHVRRTLISSGAGWLDAEPEIKQIQPDIYIVNEDGDQPSKRDYCRQNGIRYLVLRRRPRPGLPRRRSTALRGF